MPLKTATLFDRDGKAIAKVSITDQRGALIMGIIQSHAFSEELCNLLAEYQELVEALVFSLLDEYEDKIEAQAISAQFENEAQRHRIGNLQVFELEVLSFTLESETF